MSSGALVATPENSRMLSATDVADPLNVMVRLWVPAAALGRYQICVLVTVAADVLIVVDCHVPPALSTTDETVKAPVQDRGITKILPAVTPVREGATLVVLPVNAPPAVL